MVKSPEKEIVELYQVGDNRRAFNVVADRLRAYVEGRKDGHTRPYMLAALTNHPLLHLSQPNPDLRYLLVARPMLPEGLVKKTGSGGQTNLDSLRYRRLDASGAPVGAEVARWTSYCVVNDVVAWGYVVHFRYDGSFDYLEEMKCDSRELDPKFAPLFKEVDADAEAQMKQEGTYGQARLSHHLLAAAQGTSPEAWHGLALPGQSESEYTV